jgi:hypothetical protein
VSKAPISWLSTDLRYAICILVICLWPVYIQHAISAAQGHCGKTVRQVYLNMTDAIHIICAPITWCSLVHAAVVN